MYFDSLRLTKANLKQFDAFYYIAKQVREGKKLKAIRHEYELYKISRNKKNVK